MGVDPEELGKELEWMRLGAPTLWLLLDLEPIDEVWPWLETTTDGKALLDPSDAWSIDDALSGVWSGVWLPLVLLAMSDSFPFP